MPVNKENKSLTRDVLEQLLGETGDGMPVILAKRLDPQIPTTNTITDYGFEGLSKVSKGGKSIWEPNRNFVLYVDGETGNCRIPNTPNNKKRLQRLSKIDKEKIKRIIIDDEGQPITREEEIEIPPTYKMLEADLAASTLINTVAAQVMNLMKGGIQQESDAPPPEKGYRKPVGHKKDIEDRLLEPLK